MCKKNKTNKTTLKFVLLSVISILIFIVSFFLGRYKVTLTDGINAQERLIILNIRLPRILCAALIGAALSAAGACFQGIFRNPMVSPDLLGASTGAGFGAALAILSGGSYFSITLSSFSFGLAAVFLAMLVSRASKINRVLALVLSGIMVSSLFSSGTSLIKLVADSESQLPAITYWLMGSLASTKIKDLCFAGSIIAAGLIPLILFRWKINILTLSEAEAKSLGVETDRLRMLVILCATLITSASVSVSGVIGWVGLVIPHFCRIIFGYDNKHLIPSSMIMGSGFLMFVDNIGRTLASSEIPLGILTSFVGAPVFLYLLIGGVSVREN